MDSADGNHFNDMMPLVSFYLGLSPDENGRMIDEIHGLDHEKLEYIHDYIQWLFPLCESSHYNPQAPVLDDDQVHAFRTNRRLQVKLIQSFKLMLAFYGFELHKNAHEIKITKSSHYLHRSEKWLTLQNHNYLRITRILTSLRILGIEEYARAFFSVLEQIYQENRSRIGETSYTYWKQALV